jgi:hypothetical protein
MSAGRSARKAKFWSEAGETRNAGAVIDNVQLTPASGARCARGGAYPGTTPEFREGGRTIMTGKTSPTRKVAALGAAIVGMVSLGTAAAAKPDWDQVANIKEAAEHIAKLQKVKGAQKAYEFIDACYKTHGLASSYSRPFEACIAQDYMLTQGLALLYSRLPPQMLQKLHAVTPADLAAAMGRRIVAAYKQYKIPVSEAEAFKKLVDKHGFPLFAKLVFPKAPPQANEQKKK